MSLKILSWNIEGRLTRFTETGRGTPEQILSEIRCHGADVVVLPEASDGDNIEPGVVDELESMGYEIHTAYYDDKGSRLGPAEANPTIKVLSNKPVVSVKRVRYGDIRNALIADVVDDAAGATYRIFAVHLDDRSEANRLLQAGDLIKRVNDSPYPVIVMGDFNAMHGEDFKAHILGTDFVGALSRVVPHGRLRGMIRRVGEMALGKTLRLIEEDTGLKTADVRHRPTSTPKLRGMSWLPSIRLIQIDHIYVSPAVCLTGFKVAHDGGSDHRALSAIVSLDSSGQ